METAIIGLFAETSLHPGTESSTGVIDLPVAREVVTGYPVIVGSSLKGALKDMARHYPPEGQYSPEDTFGAPDSAGQLMVGDARLLLLPVRSLTAPYRWVTCPYVLERFQRDLALAGHSGDFAIPRPDDNSAVAVGEGRLFLEEVCLEITPGDVGGVIEAVAPLVYHQSVQERLAAQLTVVSDFNFHHFANYGLQVNARNSLNPDTKTSENLWYEETIPPDTLFYACLISRVGARTVLDTVQAMFRTRPYLQVGGNETVGQGWCCVTLMAAGGGADG